MKKYILILLILTGCYELKSQEVPIIRVIDGDTYEVLLNGKKQPIRLMNVDAPELKQAFGAAVKDSLSHLLKNKTVEITAFRLDIYGRLLVQINYQGKALDSLLVAKGWAWCYEEYNTNKTLPTLQILTIAQRKGLWHCNKPVPP
jgi:endonuclease YncB( thermonuclease family)